MARPAVITEALAGLEPIGIRPADLVPAPVALFNALAPMTLDASGVGLFVNIGHNQTELAIGSARGLLFARAFPMGGRQFTEAVARLAGITLTQADKQKQQEGTIEPGGPLAEALRPLAQQRGGQLWCVFGCGGDRDPAKRPLMAQAAENGADRVVVTSDNPRTEDPKAIIAQVLCGLEQTNGVLVQADRALAIAAAVQQAAPQDVVLVAGKGHEDYQEINGQRTHFSDQEHVQMALDKRAQQAREGATA